MELGQAVTAKHLTLLLIPLPLCSSNILAVPARDIGVVPEVSSPSNVRRGACLGHTMPDPGTISPAWTWLLGREESTQSYSKILARSFI
jgi:hypothetical protein